MMDQALPTDDRWQVAGGRMARTVSPTLHETKSRPSMKGTVRIVAMLQANTHRNLDGTETESCYEDCWRDETMGSPEVKASIDRFAMSGAERCTVEPAFIGIIIAPVRLPGSKYYRR